MKVALKEVHKREDKRLVIYRNFQSSLQSIKHNKENNPILNQIYYVLLELQIQYKQIILCKIPTHIEIKGNEEADKTVKVRDMPGMAKGLEKQHF